MKVLLQRVKTAKVTVNGRTVSEIKAGLLVFLGIKNTDNEKDIDSLINKIANLRIFPDEKDKMNLSLLDFKGEVLIVSQFTLYADCKRGRRPGFEEAAKPDDASSLYKKFIQQFRLLGVKCEEGEFGAMMDVSLVNWGPVTIMLETEEKL